MTQADKIRKSSPILFAALLLVLALLTSLASHAGAFSDASARYSLGTGDAVSIMKGYRQTPNLLRDGLQWWYGPWISVNNDHPYYRPISSYVHWFQVNLYVHYGWAYTTFVTLTLHAILAMWCGLAARRFSGSMVAAIVSTLAFAAFHYEPSTSPAEGLSWFPIADSITAMIFLAPAVLLFDKWNETGDRRQYAASLVCAALALLSKEYACVYPLLTLAIVLYRNDPGEAKRKLKSVVPGIVLVIVFLAWRRAVVPHSTNGIGIMFRVLRRMLSKEIDIAHQAGLLAGLASMHDDWAFVIPLIAMAIAGLMLSYLAWSYRRRSDVALLCALFLLSFTPLVKLAYDGHRALYTIFWLPSLASVCIAELLRMYRAVGENTVISTVATEE